MFVCSWNHTILQKWTPHALSSELLQKILKENKQNSLLLTRDYAFFFSHFKEEITHVCGKPLEVQSFAAHSPPMFMQITAWNLRDSLIAWRVLWSWNNIILSYNLSVSLQPLAWKVTQVLCLIEVPLLRKLLLLSKIKTNIFLSGC